MKKSFGHLLILMAFAGSLPALSSCGKQEQSPNASVQEQTTVPEKAEAVNTTAAIPAEPAEKKIPKLLDLGAHKCIPCKKMAPILEELTREYAGRMEVEFIDVWQNSAAGKKYGISTIPTQIFYGSDGKELFRHEGFLAKEDILAKWAELGYQFPEKGEKQ